MINRFLKRIRQRQKQIAEARQHFQGLSPTIIDAFFANFGYAMPLSLLAKIQSICKIVKPRLVVEFGSGLSTVVISDTISEHEGFLITFDESMKWLVNTYQMVNHKSNIAFVCISEVNGINHVALAKYISYKHKPELVVIDGPTGGDRFSESAMAVYYSLLSSDCVCVIDDTDRSENDLAAQRLAADFSLCKRDFGDPYYTRHKYSTLLPLEFDEKVTQ
jgi:cephalosporin hydroxylase